MCLRSPSRIWLVIFIVQFVSLAWRRANTKVVRNQPYGSCNTGFGEDSRGVTAFIPAICLHAGTIQVALFTFYKRYVYGRPHYYIGLDCLVAVGLEAASST